MNIRSFFSFTIPTLLAGMLLFATVAGAAESGASLIGTRTTNFSLSSDRNSLVKYGEDYYGKYNLVVSFFPAAFTPV